MSHNSNHKPNITVLPPPDPRARWGLGSPLAAAVRRLAADPSVCCARIQGVVDAEKNPGAAVAVHFRDGRTLRTEPVACDLAAAYLMVPFPPDA